ncbi:hypothetical protein ETAA8_40950 [Anatilimnocola aggregata]|uniref:Uncharacterized protein n=1 Tax=Anatilimnocola aggregata TaxID=2528021 RepID=A0A517YFI8_9BACT|nr:hypothetical protein ETAA8_40950 [Anatilimnocola aggregata]
MIDVRTLLLTNANLIRWPLVGKLFHVAKLETPDDSLRPHGGIAAPLVSCIFCFTGRMLPCLC